MARRNGRRDDPAAGHDADGGSEQQLSAPVVESLLEDGYGADEIAAFYNLPVRRVRRFLRRHGLEEPAAAESASSSSDERGLWEDQQVPAAWARGTRSTGGSGGRQRGRRLSAAQLDELCTLYLDPSLSLGEVASYFDLDQETALALIDERLTGISSRP